MGNSTAAGNKRSLQHSAHVPGRKIARLAASQRFSASQPSLPSTVPDSTRLVKMSHGSARSGDTQPLSQWVFDAYDEEHRYLPQHKPMVGGNGQVLGKGSYVPSTNSPGQSGRVDILGIFDQTNTHVEEELVEKHVEDRKTEDNDEDIGEASQLDVHAELYPEANRFQVPKTPATHGKKRNHDGEPIHHGPATPALPVNPFANDKRGDIGVMGLSQVFRATQAPSSPFANVLPSDATTHRPSPHTYSVQRPSTGRPSSSPAKLPRQGLQRSVTEPYTNYVSMLESQAEREKQLQMQATSSPLRARRGPQDDSDDDFGIEESQLRRRMRQKKIDFEAAQQFDSVRARPRPGTSNGSHRPSIYGARRAAHVLSPATGYRPRNAVLISDDLLPDELEENPSEEETEQEEAHTPDIEKPDELGEDNKENFESRRVQVPMTISKSPSKVFLAASNQSSPIKRRLRSSPAQDDVDELAIDHRGIEPGSTTVVALAPVSEQVAVADSQLSQSSHQQRQAQLTGKGIILEPLSSTESGVAVPQSQYPNLPNTSQIDSSLARRFVNGSSQLMDLASSPPLILNEDGVTSHSKSPSSGSRSAQHLPAKQGASSPQKEDRSGGLPTLAGIETAPPTPSKYGSGTSNHRTPLQANATLRSTIPETSSALRDKETVAPLPGSHDVAQSGSVVSANKICSPPKLRRRQEPSANSTLFETAQTHLTPSKLRTQALRRSCEPTLSPKRQVNRATKSFADIAADPTPPDELGIEDVDINIMTAEDTEFQALVEGSSPIGPIRKRRRRYSGRAICAAERQPSEAVVLPSSHLSFLEKIDAAVDEPVVGKENTEASFGSKDTRYPVHNSGDTLDVIQVSPSKPSNKEMNKLMNNGRIPACLSKSTSKQLSKKPQKKPRAVDTPEVQLQAHPHHPKAISDIAVTTPEPSVANTIVAPNSVFAHFNGNYSGYYPATCLGMVGGDEPKYKIRFDDGTVDTINGASVKRLELRVGDLVKVDRPAARSHTYIVLGMQDKHSASNETTFGTPSGSRRARLGNVSKFAVTDMFGHTNVLVRLKHGLKTPDRDHSSEEVVPLASIYLTSVLWRSLKDRLYNYEPSPPDPTSGLQTPSERPSTPSTPSSRNRRAKLLARAGTIPSAPTSISRTTSSLFDNLLFSITSIENSTTRAETLAHIRCNGGTILETGFDSLFDIPDLPSAGPTRCCTPETFRLKVTSSARGFTCLIADKHCRTHKFFQALALDIPCLAPRWVRDCISKQTLLPWQPYLLPSGDSTFLGTVRTRLLPNCAPDTVKLPALIAHRPAFLAGASVLLIMGKGKEEQMMKAYPFIAYALGAAQVSRAVSLEAAKKVLENGEHWDWVCYHEREGTGRRQAESVLFGGRGRKRNSGGEGTRVVVTEFVVQSLILGQLMEED